MLGSRDAPTFNLYARVATRASTSYYGVTHPSLPNYLALVAGSTFGYTTNCVDCPIAAHGASRTRSKRPGERGRRTRRDCRDPASSAAPAAATRRSTTRSLTSAPIVGEPGAPRARSSRSGSSTSDLRGGQLPDFAFVVPDLCNSMHDCSVRTGDTWLRRTVGAAARSCRARRSSSPSTRARATCAAAATSRRSSSAPPSGRRRRSAPVTNHYGLLRTIEQAWGLPLLGRSATRDADHRDLALAQEGFGRAAGMRSARCWPLSLQRKPRAIPRRRHTARASPTSPSGWPPGWAGTTPACARSASGARLHDIGKVMISETILRKRGPLSPQELAEIRTHPTAGARLIAPVGPAQTALCRTCSTTTSAGTGSGYPTSRPGPRSRRARACSPSSTPSTR